MADGVYYHLERMLPELDDLQQRRLFSASEIKEIAKQRREFEFRLQRRSKLKEDFLRYVEYELQLESLRKLRKKALVRELHASKRRWQTSLCDRASAMRIMLIYERAVTRFKGDLDLWMRYLEYCRSQGTRRMQKVLNKALRLHPTVPGLWIYAAAWEFDNNENVAAARILMQRGLRMCAQSENLWVEYFRMELASAERLKANSFVSDLDATVTRARRSGESEDGEKVEVPLRIIDDEQMAVTADSALEKQEFEARISHGDELAQKLAWAIYRNAISAIPSSPTLRQSFVEVLQKAGFEQASDLEEEILRSVQKDFPTDEGCWDWQARTQFEKVEKLSFGDALEKAIQVYETALRVVPSAVMYESYVKFLEDLLNSNGHKYEKFISSLEQTSKDKFDMAGALLQLYKKAKESGAMSPHLAEGHATLLLRLDKVDAAKELLKGLCCGDLKACAKLWAMRIIIEIKTQLISESGLGQIADLCEQSFKEIPATEARDVWQLTLEYFAGQTAFYDRVVEMLKVKMAASGGGQTCAELACSLIDWIIHNQDIDQTRKVYNRFLTLPGPSIDLYKHCIRVESRMAAMGCKEGLQHMRKLFQSAVDMHGQDTGLWLEYCSQEMKAGDLEAASAVYWRAKKTLDNPSSFIEGYQSLLSKA